MILVVDDDPQVHAMTEVLLRDFAFQGRGFEVVSAYSAIDARAVLANRPGIQIVGDRFVFQSEVLFAVGSAELTNAGADEVNKLAETLKQISTQIPKEIPWVLRVDGHADRQRIEAGRWGSNWELSAGRAITVIKLLVADGIPPTRLAATGFADNQPLDPADTPEAYARNRRIELRLTDR